jgi:hypothetical protein
MYGRLWQSSVLAMVWASAACGGSVSSSLGGNDAGADAPTSPIDRDAKTSSGADAGQVLDTASPADAGLSPETSTTVPESAAPQLYDGTTGKACTTDADCKSANGPELARCSNSVFAPDDYYPTPVCVIPSCTTVSDVSGLHYCDGPDDASSPGVCIALGSDGTGTCVPKCSYDKAGDKATGCQGKDTCRAYSPAAETGLGYCWAGCTQDGDCESGQHCQTDRGTCVAGVVPPTKSIGEACTVADEDDDACRCFYGVASQTGYCSSFCIVGGPGTCPTGYVCDALEYRSDGFSVQNTGMAGFCVATCPMTDAAGTCPPNSTCSDINVAGPDCVP